MASPFRHSSDLADPQKPGIAEKQTERASSSSQTCVSMKWQSRSVLGVDCERTYPSSTRRSQSAGETLLNGLNASVIEFMFATAPRNASHRSKSSPPTAAVRSHSWSIEFKRLSTLSAWGSDGLNFPLRKYGRESRRSTTT